MGSEYSRRDMPFIKMKFKILSNSGNNPAASSLLRCIRLRYVVLETMRTDECRICLIKKSFPKARQASAAVPDFWTNELESTHVSVLLPPGRVFVMSRPFAVGGKGKASAVVTTLGEVDAAVSTLGRLHQRPAMSLFLYQIL